MEFLFERLSDCVSMSLRIRAVIFSLNVAATLWYVQGREFKHTNLFQLAMVAGPNSRSIELVLLFFQFIISWPDNKRGRLS